jgi:hypothetical protein
MPRQVTRLTNERRLQRVLAALERELLQASDAEVRQAASDLGIDPDMKGSIAWLGIFFPAKWRRLDDVFGMKGLRSQSQRRISPPKKPD